MDHKDTKRVEPTLGGAPDIDSPAEKTPASEKSAIPEVSARMEDRAANFKLKEELAKRKAKRLQIVTGAALALGVAAFFFYPHGEQSESTAPAVAKQATPAVEKKPDETDCANAYNELRQGQLSVKTAEIRQDCKQHFENFTKLVRTDYAVKGNALYVRDVTMSLFGMTIERTTTKLMPMLPETIPAILVTSAGRTSMTLKFGNTDEADMAFKLLSDAIACAASKCSSKR